MRFNINKQIKEKTESVSEFLKDNKEIVIKNFITQLLKSEKDQIKSRKKILRKHLMIAQSNWTTIIRLL